MVAPQYLAFGEMMQIPADRSHLFGNRHGNSQTRENEVQMIARCAVDDCAIRINRMRRYAIPGWIES